MQLTAHLMQDFSTTDSPGSKPRVLTVRGLSLILFRASQLGGKFKPALGTLLKQLNHVFTGADMAWQAEVGPGLNLLHPTGVVVGKYVKIGKNCMIQDGVTLGGRGGTNDGHPTVQDNVQIGCGAKLLGPVVIGNYAKIGANAVVLNDVPDKATAVGIPARHRIPTS